MFDPVHLQAFLAVAETRSFTGAARRLGVSQPTVSQQVRKLEDAAGHQLVLRDTRAVALTDHGDAMAGFARSILAAHTAASDYFTGSTTVGRLRFGAPEDLAATPLPDILRHFRQSHPHIDLELVVAQGSVLHRRLRAGLLDLVLIKQFAESSHPSSTDVGEVVRTDALVWIGRDSTVIPRGEQVPLVVFGSPSISRRLAIDALEADGRTWHIACNTRELGGMLAAVRAGLGVAPHPASLIPDDLREVGVRLGLPTLGRVNFALLSNPRAPQQLVRSLTDSIMAGALRGGA